MCMGGWAWKKQGKAAAGRVLSGMWLCTGGQGHTHLHAMLPSLLSKRARCARAAGRPASQAAVRRRAASPARHACTFAHALNDHLLNRPAHPAHLCHGSSAHPPTPLPPPPTPHTPTQVSMAVIELQRLLPNARVLYCSATGVSEVGKDRPGGRRGGGEGRGGAGCGGA